MRTRLNYIISAVFVFMMIMPFNYQIIKLSLLLICIIIAFFYGYNHIRVSIAKWSFAYLFCNLIAILFALIYGNPGYMFYINTYFLWPILYMLLFSSLNTDFYEVFHKFLRIGIWIVLTLGLYSFIFYNMNGLLKEDIFGIEPMIRPGLPFIAIDSGCVNSIIFLCSYFIAYSLYNKERNILMLFFCFVFIFITSRRIMYLNLFLAIFAYYYFLRKCHIPINLKVLKYLFFIAFIFILVSVSVIIYYDWFSLADMQNFFSEVSDASDSERVAQFDSLIAGWVDRPLFGNGTGVNASYVRSDIPGMYELTYISMLFERGIIGFFFFMGLLLYLNKKAIKILSRNPIYRQYLLPLLIAVDMMLVANTSNNYTQAFDYTWMLFILFPYLSKNEYGKDLRCYSRV